MSLEVVRVRMEMQQLRARMERLEAENDANPAKGKMLRLETEMEEIREVRLREGEMAADVIERAAAADAAPEETERMNLVLEAQRDASERAASESEEMAAAAKEARAAAEEQRVAAEMAKRTAEENMARVQATFDEQKALQEEMFGQIEALDAIARNSRRNSRRQTPRATPPAPRRKRPNKRSRRWRPRRLRLKRLRKRLRRLRHLSWRRWYREG